MDRESSMGNKFEGRERVERICGRDETCFEAKVISLFFPFTGGTILTSRICNQV